MSREAVLQEILSRRGSSPSVTDVVEDSKTSMTQRKQQILQEVKQRRDEAAQKVTRKQPSIARRMYAAAAFPDEGKRKAYMMDKGFEPEYDLPLGSGGAREFAADWMESPVLQSGRMAGLIGGEAVGGMFAGKPGYVAGGAAGSAAVQGLIEDTAKNIDRVRAIARRTPGLQDSDFAQAPDISVEGSEARVAREALMGGTAATLGLAMKGGTGLVRKAAQTKVGRVLTYIPRTFAEAVKKGAKAVESYLLTNVSIMTKPMQEYVKNNWSRLSKLAQSNKLMSHLDSNIQKRFIGPLKAAQRTLGAQVGVAKQQAMKDLTSVDMTGLGEEAKNIAARYAGNVTSTEASKTVQIARNLERLNRFARMLESNVPAKGKIAGLEAFKRRLANLYMSTYDDLIEMSRKVSGGMQGAGGPSPLTSMMGEIKKAVMNKYGMTSGASEAFSKYSELTSLSDDIINLLGPDSKTQLDNLSKFILADDKPANFHVKQAMHNVIANANRLGIDITPGVMTRMKDIITATWMKDPRLLTAGVKTFLLPAAGGTVGGAAGAAVDALTGTTGRRGRWARTGTAIGAGITLPYMTPKTTAIMYRALEQGSGATKAAASAIAKAAPDIVARARLVEKPVNDAIESIRRKFMGVEDEEEQY